MILTFSECIEKYVSKYRIKKLMSEGKLYQLEKGIYSEKKSRMIMDALQMEVF